MNEILEIEELRTAVGLISERDFSTASPRLCLTSSRKLSCRICLEEDMEKNMISPCECRGSVAFVHANCLQHWFDVMHTKTCQMCKTEYEQENRGLKPWKEWVLPRPLGDDWEDELDFKCAIFWVLFMLRVSYISLRYGTHQMRDVVAEILGGGKIYYIWWISFWVNFVYYGIVVYIIGNQWIESNSVYEWRNKKRDNKMN